ncbi:MAG: AEC family transporter [Lacisediminihabitans sp.]
MSGVLIGFAIIGTVILVGYVVARLNLLGGHALFVLGRIVFFVLSPCLLFTVLADANVHVLFSSLLVVSLVAAVLAFVIFALVALLIWRRAIPEAVIGSLAAGYVNANNIGIPVALYVLGNTAYSAPVVLLQLLVFAPIALTILDIRTTGKVSLGRILLQPVKNPIIIGSALGVLLSVLQLHLPSAVMEPFRMIGAAAVPMVLIAFGMSLHGQKILRPGSGRRDVLLASAIKLVVMPVIAWLLGRFVFGLEGQHLFAVVVLAALPTAQNVFNYAQRYERGEIIARDAVLITTVGAVPVLVLIAALLH